MSVHTFSKLVAETQHRPRTGWGLNQRLTISEEELAIRHELVDEGKVGCAVDITLPIPHSKLADLLMQAIEHYNRLFTVTDGVTVKASNPRLKYLSFRAGGREIGFYEDDYDAIKQWAEQHSTGTVPCAYCGEEATQAFHNWQTTERIAACAAHQPEDADSYIAVSIASV